MALINCSECGKEISTNAKNCPNCGSPVILPLSQKESKRRKTNKWAKYITLFLLLFIVYKCISSMNKDEEDKIALVSKLRDEHCKVTWKDLNKEQKQKILHEFITNESDLTRVLDKSSVKMLASDAYQLLRASTRYPETIKVDGELQNSIIYLSSRDAKILDIEKGTIEYSKSFTSENKLGMTVKGLLLLTIKYNAGCKTYEIVDFKAE